MAWDLSSDGSSIAVAGPDDSVFRIHVIPVGGGPGSAVRLDRAAAALDAVAWMPDSKGWIGVVNLGRPGTWITSVLVAQRAWIQGFGGLFLLWLGVSTFFARPAERAAESRAASLLGAFASTFLLTLTNPMTILSFLAVFAGLGLGAGALSSPSLALMLIVGVLTGSATWWLLLSGVVDLLRSRFRPEGMVWTNRVSGIVITGFGILALIGLLRAST